MAHEVERVEATLLEDQVLAGISRDFGGILQLAQEPPLLSAAEHRDLAGRPRSSLGCCIMEAVLDYFMEGANVIIIITIPLFLQHLYKC